jgi:hypothetical protein
MHLVSIKIIILYKITWLFKWKGNRAQDGSMLPPVNMAKYHHVALLEIQ